MSLFMEKFFRDNLSGVLWTGAALIGGALLWYGISAGLFVASSVRSAYGDDLIKDGEIATFDLASVEDFKKLRAR